jgi:hypothetical protein
VALYFNRISLGWMCVSASERKATNFSFTSVLRKFFRRETSSAANSAEGEGSNSVVIVEVGQ